MVCPIITLCTVDLKNVPHLKSVSQSSLWTQMSASTRPLLLMMHLHVLLSTGAKLAIQHLSWKILILVQV